MKKTILELKNGESGNVKSVTAGKDATRRLYEMGFNTGAPVKIVKNDSGPIIVCLDGNKVAIGRGLAERITLDIK